MICTRTDTDKDAHLRLEGTIDAATTTGLRSTFDAVVADKPRLVTVDLAGVTMLDSSGVGLLVGLAKRVRAEGGELVVVGAVEQPLLVIRLLKLTPFFGMEN